MAKKKKKNRNNFLFSLRVNGHLLKKQLLIVAIKANGKSAKVSLLS